MERSSSPSLKNSADIESANNLNQQKPKDVTLSDIRESHNDGQEVEQGPIRPVALGKTGEQSQGWWFWRSQQPGEVIKDIPTSGEQQMSPQSQAIENSPSPQVMAVDPVHSNHQEMLSEDRRESWVDWINPVRRMSSVVSYVYTSPTPNEINAAMNTVQPNQLSSLINSSEISDTPNGVELSAHTSSKSIATENPKNGGILPWFLPWTYFQGSNPKDDDLDIPESMYSSKDSEELAKDAKKAIEGNESEGRNSSWAFWSSAKNKNGELAVSGTGSEFHPARVNDPPTTYYENQEEQQFKQPPQQQELKSSLVLPDFDKYTRSSTTKNKSRIFLSSSKLLRQTFDIKRQTHLYRSPKPAPIKKVVVIGIHGFFPIKMVRTLIGHPTGTSMKFATKATEVVTKWAADNKMDIEVETIALEGEGKIIERVEHLVKLLENWIGMIRKADFIYIASHSQGVMVSIHLVAELILRNLISTKKTKIGMLNMCGVCNGPIVGLDSKLIVKLYSKFENEILMELFDFQDLKSFQSVKLLNSMKTLLSNNVKITFVGSINDQLSPLYSSLFTVVSHPNISRGLFVDKNTNEEIPDFLVKLVEDCIISQNMGYSDSDLLFELSKYSSGSLTNGGHSKVYNEDEVYLLGIRNALELDDLYLKRSPVLNISNPDFSARNINKNPYHLPWCLRGFIDELVSIRNLDGEKLRKELLDSCQSWSPQSKIHKELKYSVEVICQNY